MQRSCDRKNRLCIEGKVVTVEKALFKRLVFILRELGRGWWWWKWREANRFVQHFRGNICQDMGVNST